VVVRLQHRGGPNPEIPRSGFLDVAVRTGAEITVAFRGAKGDYATVIDSPVLSASWRALWPLVGSDSRLNPNGPPATSALPLPRSLFVCGKIFWQARGTGCLPGVAGSPVEFTTGKMPVPRWRPSASKSCHARLFGALVRHRIMRMSWARSQRRPIQVALPRRMEAHAATCGEATNLGRSHGRKGSNRLAIGEGC
jgi:hypothetical protein